MTLATPTAAEETGTPAAALQHATRMLPRRPDLAEQQAREVLRAAPGHPQAELVLALARRSQGDLHAARDLLRSLAQRQPNWAAAHHELGVTLAGLGEGSAATSALRRAVALKPDLAAAWLALGDQAMLAEDAAGADRAYAQAIRASVADPELTRAAVALCDDRLDIAEPLLRERLKQRPTDVAAIRMLAELGARLGRYADAEALLARCLQLAPSFTGARHGYAVVLFRQQKAAEALAQIDRLLADEPGNPTYRNLQAGALAHLGEYERSIETYAAVLDKRPDQPRIWLSYGHALKTAGRQGDSVAAYRRALHLSPELGEAYWSLANLKTARFSPEDITAMQGQLARPVLDDDHRLHLHYALGKALEDAGDYAGSFRHYAEGAAIRRRRVPYDADATTEQMRRAAAFFTDDLFAARKGCGHPAPDPIFVVGLPRSGSTLIEQILASHSQVEGTMELAELAAVAKSVGRVRDRGGDYPEALSELDDAALAALGRRFLDATQVQRKTAKPFFIDKMPNNFLHVGLIQLIIPRARIIDARRHPMGTCFSAFKQHFARGQNFSYSLDDLGRYYVDYVALMAHFDRALPGRVHRVIYEDLVTDTEAEVRRLLEHCGLKFEPDCLRFYDNDRAVRTASSEQVRRPIFRDGLEQWRRYEPWLGPLEAALGSTLHNYRAPSGQIDATAQSPGDG